MSRSAGALRGSDEAATHPFGDALPGMFGRCGDEGVFVGGEADAPEFGAGVVDGWSAGSHARNYSGHRKFPKGLDSTDIGGHNKYMTMTLAEQPIPARGSGPVECTDSRCHGHRARCNFGRPHVWSTWYENGQLMRTVDTFHCHDCGGVCVGDES